MGSLTAACMTRHVQAQKVPVLGLRLWALKGASPSIPLLSLGSSKLSFLLFGSLLPTRLWSHHPLLQTTLRTRLP